MNKRKQCLSDLVVQTQNSSYSGELQVQGQPGQLNEKEREGRKGDVEGREGEREKEGEKNGEARA